MVMIPQHVPKPGIYRGELRHRRFRPKPHEFTYSLFMAFLDIDRIAESMQKCAYSSYNRFNWASFDQRDHFGDPSQPLRKRLEEDAKTHGVPLPDGPIFLLTHLRYLGYCFNPISLFYFYDTSGNVPVVLAEVNNTFGESRNYWLWAGNRRPADNALHFLCPKTLHVSPFMGMNLDYDFVLTPPGNTLITHMNTLDGGDHLFDATLSLQYHPWTSASLVRALASQPWMTAKVISAIHWEALRLWLKGTPVFTHPDRVSKSIEGSPHS
jgi:uncharacterized protein